VHLLFRVADDRVEPHPVFALDALLELGVNVERRLRVGVADLASRIWRRSSWRAVGVVRRKGREAVLLPFLAGEYRGFADDLSDALRQPVEVPDERLSEVRTHLDDAPRGRLVAGPRGASFANVPSSGVNNRVRSRARRRIVLDPEHRRVGVRRNERRIGGRPIGARGLPRIIAALDEHAACREARPVRRRAAV
jgi:hypothetical protein